MGLKTIICTDCGQVVLKEAAYRCERCDNWFCPECMFGREICKGCASQTWLEGGEIKLTSTVGIRKVGPWSYDIQSLYG